MEPSGESRNDATVLSTLLAFLQERRYTARGFKMTALSLKSVTVLVTLIVVNVSTSHIPEKYPIEVYHMLQERTQLAIGHDNRVRGTWGTWSAWSDCSRTCGTGIQSQSRECVPIRRLLRKRSIISENGTSNVRPICIGTYKRYHTCNIQECPNFPEDLRAEQCAKYNGRNYKGQTYTWVPFLDAPNSCALNCRAVGQRFYATLEPAVMDGTPCDGPNPRGGGHNAGISVERTERWLCVSGRCKPVGCDGVVGSGAVMDSCGVCGGQGKGCRLFEGIFMEPHLPRGHHEVTVIPKGAMSLNISELRFSNNFLALRDGNGSYVLNGPWSYSPSGTYKAAGTTLTYQKGDRSRLECIVATGPLNESLHLEILFQELNPGVLYKYMLPLKKGLDRTPSLPSLPSLSARASNDRGNEIPSEDSHVTTVAVPLSKAFDHSVDLTSAIGKEDRMRHAGRREGAKHTPTTVMAGDQPNSKTKKKKRKKFVWKISGLTTCSKECGGGIQMSIFKCVREASDTVVHEKRCRHTKKPEAPPPLRCNDHPCPARWRAEPWGECSVTCGMGTRTRKLECVQELNSRLTMRVAAGACIQPPDLRTVETCTKPACPNVTPELRHMHSMHDAPRWDVGTWSPCSTTCGPGIRTRTVTCITSGESCPLSIKPESREDCKNPACIVKNSEQRAPWLYSPWSSKCSTECGKGVETRQIACSQGSELFCDPKERPETERQCFGSAINCDKFKWFTGTWTSCSVSCGIGVQYREILCIESTATEFVVQSEKHCTSTKPATEQVCRMTSCSPQWYVSDWSKCSVTCGNGVQTRSVRCILEGVPASNCTEHTKPIDQQKCDMKACRKEIMLSIKPPKKVHESAECVDKYPNCALVVKNGLCRIKYYKHSCCRCRE